MATTQNRSVQSSAWRIVEYLQKEGAATHKELQAYLGLTRTAVQEHLATLEAGGYVARRLVQAGRGRPHYEYSNADKARDLFACHCGDLAVLMLSEMQRVMEPDAMAQLMQRLARRVAQEYAAEMTAERTRGRVKELAARMAQRGILCQVKENAADATVYLELFNCPYHELALEDRRICDMDRDMIGQAVQAPVELVDCIMDEAGSCKFGFKVEG